MQRIKKKLVDTASKTRSKTHTKQSLPCNDGTIHENHHSLVDAREQIAVRHRKYPSQSITIIGQQQTTNLHR